jgi:hypothetical protein
MLDQRQGHLADDRTELLDLVGDLGCLVMLTPSIQHPVQQHQLGHGVPGPEALLADRHGRGGWTDRITHIRRTDWHGQLAGELSKNVLAGACLGLLLRAGLGRWDGLSPGRGARQEQHGHTGRQARHLDHVICLLIVPTSGQTREA